MSALKSHKLSPAQIIMLSFLFLIAVGTFLLMLPISTTIPGHASFMDAVFTATSATCVTGLVVQDTSLYWSLFGQAVILLLIQIGGMGVVTMGIMIFMFSGRKISLRQRWVMQESISAPQVGGIIRETRFLLTGSLLIEASGTLLLAARFCRQLGFGKGLWYAVFHSISAFCNAGFDLMGAVQDAEFSSLTAYTADPLVNFSIFLLIVVGGLGFLTWHDLRSHKFHLHAYRLQSKLILTTTVMLLLAGFFHFFFYEFRLPQWSGMGTRERFFAASFQSVTTRTAGFNTVDLTALSETGQLITILLMLVGGSTGSTAGGIKTTTLAVLLLSARAIFRHQDSARCFGRRIHESALRNASALLVLYLLLFLTGGCLVACIDEIPLMAALFESASAVATVGLSLGYTPHLSSASHLILIFLMYFGRVGGLTMIYAVAANRPASVSQFPQEHVSVG